MVNTEVTLQHRVGLLQRALRPALRHGESLVDKVDTVHAERIECDVGVLEARPAVPASIRTRCVAMFQFAMTANSNGARVVEWSSEAEIMRS